MTMPRSSSHAKAVPVSAPSREIADEDVTLGADLIRRQGMLARRHGRTAKECPYSVHLAPVNRSRWMFGYRVEEAREVRLREQRWRNRMADMRQGELDDQLARAEERIALGL